MGYRYIVKSYQWTNGVISSVVVTFDNEILALEYARSKSPAETVKVYIEDEVVYAANRNPITPGYAG